MGLHMMQQYREHISRQRYSLQEFSEKCGFPGVQGVIVYAHLQLHAPSDDGIIYGNRNTVPSIFIQMGYAANCKVTHVSFALASCHLQGLLPCMVGCQGQLLAIKKMATPAIHCHAHCQLAKDDQTSPVVHYNIAFRKSVLALWCFQTTIHHETDIEHTDEPLHALIHQQQCLTSVH